MKRLLSFPKEHFVNNSQRPLTHLMIQTLKLACEKQHQGILFGPQDVKGSVIALINRGLIAGHIIEHKGKRYNSWYVTPLAMDMLENIGIKIICRKVTAN